MCVNCQRTCWINLEAIEAWKEDAVGTATKRILKIALCWMCAVGKRKCRLLATREFWKGETCEPKWKESKEKAWSCNDSTVPSVVSSATLSTKQKQVEVEMPGRPWKRLATQGVGQNDRGGAPQGVAEVVEVDRHAAEGDRGGAP